MADIECPSCGTLLRNAQPGPDGHLRCLNCGKRFAAAASGAASSEANAVSPAPSTSATAAGDASATPGRKPAAGSYGLVMVLGYLLLLVSCALGIGFGYGALSMLGTRGRYGVGISEVAMLGALAAGMPCLGLSGLFLLRRLAPIDAAAVQLAWRRGALVEGMPQTPGSSLPYILPVTAGGGLLAILPILATAEFDTYNRGLPMEVALTALPAGALLALLGLALGELRRFLWRLEFTADSLAERLEAAPNRFQVHPPGCYGLGDVILLCAAGAAVVTMLAILSDMSRYADRKDLSFWLAMVLLYPGGLFSLGLLTRAAGRTLAAWNRALQVLDPGTRRYGGQPGPSEAISHLFKWFSIPWAALLFLNALHEMTTWRQASRLDDEYVGAMSATLTAGLTAVWMATLFAGVYRARALVNGCLDSHSKSQAVREAEKSPARLLKWALLALAGIILLFLLPNLNGREWFLLLLVVAGLAYAAVWLGFLADEMRLLAIDAQVLANFEPKAPPAPADLPPLPPESFDA